MTIRTRVAKLESATGSGALSPALRAWLGESLTSAEQREAEIEDAQPHSEKHLNITEEELRWLQA